MSDHCGKYSDNKSSSKTFDRDTSFIHKATRGGEGEDSSSPKPDWAGGRTARKPGVDPDLSYTNSGFGNRKEKKLAVIDFESGGSGCSTGR
jgi:hypothetical protein